MEGAAKTAKKLETSIVHNVPRIYEVNPAPCGLDKSWKKYNIRGNFINRAF